MYTLRFCEILTMKLDYADDTDSETTRNELRYYEPGYLFTHSFQLYLCILLDDDHSTGLGVMVSYQCIEVDTTAD